MKKKVLVLMFIVVLVINVTALAALAYNRWLKHPISTAEIEGENSWNTLQKKIALTPSQLSELQVQRDHFSDHIQSLRMEIALKRIELLEEIRKAHPDMEYIEQMIDIISRSQADIQKQTVRNLLKDKDVLSLDQRDQYFSLFLEQARAQGRGRGLQFRGRRGQGRRGKNRNTTY